MINHLSSSLNFVSRFCQYYHRVWKDTQTFGSLYWWYNQTHKHYTLHLSRDLNSDRYVTIYTWNMYTYCIYIQYTFLQTVYESRAERADSWSPPHWEDEAALSVTSRHAEKRFDAFCPVFYWWQRQITPRTRGIRSTLPQLVCGNILFGLRHHQHS